MHTKHRCGDRLLLVLAHVLNEGALIDLCCVGDAAFCYHYYLQLVIVLNATRCDACRCIYKVIINYANCKVGLQTWHCPYLLLSAVPVSNWSISPARRRHSLANPQQRRGAGKWWDRRTDKETYRRTPDRYIHPVPHTMPAVPISKTCNNWIPLVHDFVQRFTVSD